MNIFEQIDSLQEQYSACDTIEKKDEILRQLNELMKTAYNIK